MAERNVDMVMVASHAIPDFDLWKAEFIKANEDKNSPVAEMGIYRATVSKLLEPNADGKTQIQVMLFFPRDKLEVVKKFHDFTGPPFVGGPDLIKNGIIIEPITVHYAEIPGEIIYPGVLDAGEALTVAVGHHGIPDYDQWHKEFTSAGIREFHTGLGCVKGYAGKAEEKTKDGKDKCFAIHFFRTSRLEDMKKIMDFKAPPFPEYIAKGIIIPPIEVSLSNVIYEVYKPSEAKTVIRKPTA